VGLLSNARFVLQHLLRTPSPPCHHVDLTRVVERQSRDCEACQQRAEKWVHLRMCLTCGQVGCCDSSRNKHATGHFRETGHPVMQSIEPGQSWMWCYVDERLVTPRVAAG
jgi:uncharacterized UBP type Zn finger protein